MNNIYVLNQDFELQGIIDEYVSTIWRPSYSDIGDFEIYLGASQKAINLLQKNRYVVRSSDISVVNYTGKNLLNNTSTSQTIKNVLFTVNEDKSVNVMGKNDGTGDSDFYLLGKWGCTDNINILPKENVIVSGSTLLRVWLFDASGKKIGGGAVGKSGLLLTKESITSASGIGIYITVGSGNTVNEIVYPMIRRSIESDEYEPYVGGVPKSITSYENVMIVKNIQLITDVENGDFLCVTGRELKFLLHQRIVWSQTVLSGTAENAIRRLVNENAVNPTDSKRVMPKLSLGVSAGLTDTIEKQVTGEYLDQAVKEICTTYNYGWDIFITDNKLVFVLYSGLDRSYQQTERPYVIFSDEFENLYNTDYQLFTEEYANTTLIGGEGEGLERTYTTVNNFNSGLDRYETFTDARDISSNKGSENEIDAATYENLLVERGRENLATLSYTEGFSGEVLSDVAFQYGKDFFLGDIVTVINEYGIQKNVRVLSAIESEDENGVKLLPQFNI